MKPETNQAQDKTSKSNSPAATPKEDGKKNNQKKGNDWFHKFAHQSSKIVGSPWAFFIAVLILLIWGILGPVFGFSDTWQLVINTATTIITFLIVFLIQNTQNRDAKAIHLKLDELLHGVKGARNKLINLENFSEEEMKQLQKEFERLRQAPSQEPKSTKPEK
ncbi:MAG: low affinity iron permease family protein [Verrucomicrobiota bacterium]|nr:low affinity iron permease family protein [Verrucomicrobiota bacterium]